MRGRGQALAEAGIYELDCKIWAEAFCSSHYSNNINQIIFIQTRFSMYGSRTLKHIKRYGERYLVAIAITAQ